MHRHKFLPQYHYRAWYRRLWTSFLDSLGTFICRAGRKRSDLPDPALVRQILVIRHDGLGDFLMSIPAIQAVHRAYPHAEIDLLVSSDSAAIARLLPEIREVFESKSSWFSNAFLFKKIVEAEQLLGKIRKLNYDLGIDFRGDLRNIVLMRRGGVQFRVGFGVTGGSFLLDRCPPYPETLHQVQVNFDLLKVLGIHAEPGSVSLQASPETQSKIRQLLPRLFSENLRPLLVIHPAAGYPSKRWPLKNFHALTASLIQREQAKIVLIGTRSDLDHDPFPDMDPVVFQDLRGKLRLDELPALFEAADLYLGNDSGPAHLAALSGLHAVVLFSGTNDVQRWRPWSQKLTVMTHPVSCSPCHAKTCKVKHHLCMEGITMDEVLQTLHPLLKTYRVTARTQHGL